MNAPIRASLIAVPLLGPVLGIFLFLFIAGLVVFVVGVAFIAFVMWLLLRHWRPKNQEEEGK